MPKKVEVAVYLPDREAALFMAFKEHHKAFAVLLESGIFHQKNAAITLNFDANGVLQVIERKDRLYSRRHALSTDYEREPLE